MIRIAHVHLWVHDQEEALAFYTQKLGMEVRGDATLPELGGYRWLTVGPAGQPEVSIVLDAIPGPPAMDSGTSEQVRDLMAKGLGRHRVPGERRSPVRPRRAQGSWSRIRRRARGTPVWNRFLLQGPVGKSDPADAASRLVMPSAS